jgi:hypothetical protein
VTFHVLQCEESAWAQVRNLEWEPFPGAFGHGRIAKPGEATVEFRNPASKTLHDLESTNEGIFLFSQRLADFVTNAGFLGIAFYPVHLVWDLDGPLFEQEIPTYFWGRITGRIGGSVFLERKLLITDPTGSIVLEHPAKLSGRRKYWHLDLNRWDGSDFCEMFPLGPGKTLCSSKVADAAKTNGWTNFSLNHTTYLSNKHTLHGNLRLDL